MTVTAATTIREGQRYRIGDYLVWYQSKPGEGRRVRLFIRGDEMVIVEHVDQKTGDGENEGISD